jgi:hypothetical protein
LEGGVGLAVKEMTVRAKLARGSRLGGPREGKFGPREVSDFLFYFLIYFSYLPFQILISQFKLVS